MRRYIILLIALVILSSGCVIEEKIPVLYTKVTMGEEVNGTMVIESIEAYAGEISPLQNPRDQYPENFPAVYVSVVQKAYKLSYQTGKDYRGPGVYDYMVAIEDKINMSMPVAVMVEAIGKDQETVDQQGMKFNWSSNKQSKTFK